MASGKYARKTAASASPAAPEAEAPKGDDATDTDTPQDATSGPQDNEVNTPQTAGAGQNDAPADGGVVDPMAATEQAGQASRAANPVPEPGEPVPGVVHQPGDDPNQAPEGGVTDLGADRAALENKDRPENPSLDPTLIHDPHQNADPEHDQVDAQTAQGITLPDGVTDIQFVNSPSDAEFEEATPDGKIIEGRAPITISKDELDENGQYVAKEDIYRRFLPENSTRPSFVLVVAKGSVLNPAALRGV